MLCTAAVGFKTGGIAPSKRSGQDDQFPVFFMDERGIFCSCAVQHLPDIGLQYTTFFLQVHHILQMELLLMGWEKVIPESPDRHRAFGEGFLSNGGDGAGGF
jgi:hypothetical protein